MAKKIKVGFMLQCPDSWDKINTVFEAMINDDRFEPCGIVVPGYEGYDIGVRPFGAWGDEWEFFHKLHPKYMIDAVDEKKNILDMRAMCFDYVFYQRPYEALLPYLLCAQYVKDFSRICYIPYGAIGAKVFEQFALKNVDFFSCVDYYFAPSKHMSELYSIYYSGSPRKPKSMALGYPAFENFFEYAGNRCPILKNKKILWTPRWSYDSVIGGSHFLEYKDEFIKFKKSHTHLPMMVRPHPLMHGELINKGLISKEDWENYLNVLNRNGIDYDKEKVVDSALLHADIMLTDFSTIIPMFFILNKPIIYCPASNIELNVDYARLLPGVYVAENWEDIDVLLKFLSQGMDIKRQKRGKIIEELKGEHVGAVKRILNYLAEEAM